MKLAFLCENKTVMTLGSSKGAADERTKQKFLLLIAFFVLLCYCGTSCIMQGVLPVRRGPGLRRRGQGRGGGARVEEEGPG